MDDWILEVKENLKELDIDLTLEEIQKKSKNSFKRLVKTKTKEYALEFLLGLNYNDIFKENIPSNISKTLMNICKLREDVI